MNQLDNILHEKRKRVMSTVGVMSLVNKLELRHKFTSSHSFKMMSQPTKIKVEATKSREKLLPTKPQVVPLVYPIRKKPGPKPKLNRRKTFIENKDTTVQPLNVQSQVLDVADTRVPISRQLLKELIKEHYKIQEHTDDEDSISSISIVAKIKKRINKSSSNCTTKDQKTSLNVLKSDQLSSSDDFMVIRQRRIGNDNEFTPY